MSDTIESLIREILSCTTEGRESVKQRNNLYLAVRNRFIHYLTSYYKCNEHLAEDLAQDKVVSLVNYLIDNNHPNPNAVIRMAAIQKFNDEHRKNRRSKANYHESIDKTDCDSDNKYSPALKQLDRFQFIEWEWGQRTSEYIANLRHQIERCLEKISDADRELLIEIYFKNRSIEELSEEDLIKQPVVQKGLRAGNRRTISEARNAIDQRLTRARVQLKRAIETQENDQ